MDSKADRFNVFKVRYGPVMSDPDVPGPRYHTVVFVETKPLDGSGRIHHVTGDLVVGMHYDVRPSRRPEESRTYYAKEFLGTVASASYPASFNSVCSTQRAPPRQKAFNPKRMRTEQVKPDGTFYEPDEARPRLIKCTEWTESQAIPALQQARLIEPTEPVHPDGRSIAAS
ncbi:hypothetical protein B0A50_06315 [Salinomyces thailandicus]|uniref:Uncharacterized protein n=1 Tax=Salinomyces thailandicus TaxID=706561 RepID=A0A4U0TTC9_9PEZI|nr:hypothetical protein B0A50_06315 [Salinomyces thailandica]